MPFIFYVISYFIPASYYINITRGVILRGAGLSQLWLDGLALYCMGSILLLIAARRFQDKVSMA
jgi:ABC-2 type transport system permease protein